MQEDTHQSLPSDLDWSNMKDGIFDKIQSIEQEGSTPGAKEESRRKRGLFFLLFFGLMLGLFSISQKLVKNHDTKAYEITQMPKTNGNNKSSNFVGKSDRENEMECPENAQTATIRKSTVSNLLFAYREAASTQDQTNAKRASNDLDEMPLYTKRTLEESQNSSLSSDLTGTSSRSVNNSQNDLTPLQESELFDLKIQTLDIPFIPFLAINPIDPEKTEYFILDHLKIENIYRPSLVKNNVPNQLILEGGMVFWDKGYGINKPEGAQFETTLTSFLMQGHYVQNLKKNYFILAGLQYLQLESRFQYNNTIQDYKIVLKDTIVQVQNNLLSGAQTIIYGDVEQTVKAERRIIHYNQSKLFKASLAIGKTWRFNSFQTDIYFGGALNSLVCNQGRTLDNNTILDYNGSSNALFQNQMKMDGVFGVRFHYLLNQNIGLTTGIQAQKSLLNWSNQENIKSYPVSLGLQLGLSYTL